MTATTKEKIVVICPGRGTYTKNELGYLNKYRPGQEDFISSVDRWLAAKGEPTVSSLDQAEKFSLRTHTPGEFASLLIYTCSACDFYAIDRSRYEVVAVTGNSMGWYTALALGGALVGDNALQVIHTMGGMMRDGVIGGQLIYPVVDESWQESDDLKSQIRAVTSKIKKDRPGELFESIYFGGYLIFGGSEVALKILMKELPQVEERYPFILVNHAAFHTPLMNSVSETGFGVLGPELFQRPAIPLVDGRGHIWQPVATDASELRDYTLGHQVTQTYDFSRAIEVAVKEFAPDRLVLVGPGSTSGGAIGQALIQHQWEGIDNKGAFAARQKDNPVLLAMGREDQFGQVVGGKSDHTPVH